MACARGPSLAPASSAPPPLAVRLDHLRHLGMDAVVNGRSVRVVALYAEAPDYRPTGSPARDGSEGIACVDDAARAAVVYLRAYEETGDARDRDEALGLLRFVAVDGAGRWRVPQFHRHTRAAEPRRAEQPQEHVVLGRAQRLGVGGRRARLRTCRPRSPGGSSRPAGPRRSADGARGGRRSIDRRIARPPPPKRCWGCSLSSGPSPRRRALRLPRALRSCSCRSRSGPSTAPPWGARLDRPDSPWHAWGSRSTAALATAALVLERPDFLVAASAEADALWTRFLLAGQIASEVAPDGTTKWFPQIAYGVSPIVEGYLALAEATKDRKYAVLAGLTAAWLARREPRRRCHVRRGDRSHVRRHRWRRGCAGEPECRSRVHDGVAARAAASDAQCRCRGVPADTGRPVSVRRRWRTFPIDESSPVPAATQSRCAGWIAGSSSWNPAAMAGRSR